VKLEYVTIEKRGGIGVVRFDRKANLNAFDEKLVIELTYAARTFFDDLGTHAVVLAGHPMHSRPVRFEGHGQLAQ
jgi:enoyl-CoA hydratase